MKMKKNILGIVILATILCLCLSSVVFTAEVIELTLWCGSWWSEKAPLIVEEFEKAYPQYKLKIDCLPINGYIDNAVVAILAGDPPDILDISIENLSGFAEKNLLTDLAADVVAKLKAEDFAAAVWDLSHYNGKMYGVPSRGSGQVMFYNMDMFDEAGVAYPKEGWTFDDLLDMAEKITVPGEKYGWAISTSTNAVNDAMRDFSSLLWGFGGDFLNEDSTKCTLDQPNAIKALTWITDVYTKHKVLPEGTIGWGVQVDSLPAFATNKLAMMNNDGIIGMNYLDDKYPDVRYDIVEIPNGGFNKVGSWVLTVPITAKHKKEAMDYLLWFAKPEVQAQLCARAPANVNAFALMGEPWNTPRYLKWFKASQNVKPMPNIGGWSEATLIITQELQNALLETKTPEQAAKDMTLQIDLLLK